MTIDHPSVPRCGCLVRYCEHRMRALFALAYLEGLQRHDAPQDAPAEPVRLDTPDRAPFVPLRGSRG